MRCLRCDRPLCAEHCPEVDGRCHSCEDHFMTISLDQQPSAWAQAGLQYLRGLSYLVIGLALIGCVSGVVWLLAQYGAWALPAPVAGFVAMLFAVDPAHRLHDRLFNPKPAAKRKLRRLRRRFLLENVSGRSRMSR